MTRALGRKIPTDWQHVEKHPFGITMEPTVAAVNKRLKLPRWHWLHDQGAEGACVGFGSSMMMSILNQGTRFTPQWLWEQAKIVDPYPDTNPGDDNGTLVSSACDVLRAKGHVKYDPGYAWPKEEQVYAEYGITSNKWATTVDQMRTGIALGIPIAIGINWYSNFDEPVETGVFKKDHWIGKGDLGKVRGGHCVCVYGASDKKQAFRIKNSWGRSYPLVWMPYTTMQRLLKELGEATLVTDR